MRLAGYEIRLRSDKLKLAVGAVGVLTAACLISFGIGYVLHTFTPYQVPASRPFVVGAVLLGFLALEVAMIAFVLIVGVLAYPFDVEEVERDAE